MLFRSFVLLEVLVSTLLCSFVSMFGWGWVGCWGECGRLAAGCWLAGCWLAGWLLEHQKGCAGKIKGLLEHQKGLAGTMKGLREHQEGCAGTIKGLLELHKGLAGPGVLFCSFVLFGGDALHAVLFVWFVRMIRPPRHFVRLFCSEVRASLLFCSFVLSGCQCPCCVARVFCSGWQLPKKLDSIVLLMGHQHLEAGGCVCVRVCAYVGCFVRAHTSNNFGLFLFLFGGLQTVFGLVFRSFVLFGPVGRFCFVRVFVRGAICSFKMTE